VHPGRVDGQQQTIRQGTPWWLQAVLAAVEQAEQGIDQLTPEERAGLALAAQRLYAAALPAGADGYDVRDFVASFAAAIFAGGNAAGAIVGSRKLQGMSAVAAAAVLAQRRYIPPPP
jgi:hypothetical protein